ncbi:uridine phosphorylase 1-like [Haemaphysalis longicornis]
MRKYAKRECSKEEPGKGRKIEIKNPHLQNMKVDILYHLALSTDTHQFKEMFGDVKFVCMGGTCQRMSRLAGFLKTGLGIELPAGAHLCDISKASGRYALYKVGPVIAISHGMGAPSLSIMMHELFKLLHHAQCTDVTLLRLGTSGGIGIFPGTLVVSTGAVNGLLKEETDVFVLGERVTRPCVLDADLAREILDVGERTLPQLSIVRGKTLCANDFYEGQGRLDGAFCSYTLEQKRKFLEKIRGMGVLNIEMTACQFSSMCHIAGVKGAIVCVTLLDRLETDQVDSSSHEIIDMEMRPQELALQYIRYKLGMPPAPNKYMV